MIYFVFHPHDSRYMRERVKRLCDTFHGESFELPKVKSEINERYGKTKIYLDNLYSTLRLTIDNYKKYLV
jgi:hypothetical protein